MSSPQHHPCHDALQDLIPADSQYDLLFDYRQDTKISCSHARIDAICNAAGLTCCRPVRVNASCDVVLMTFRRQELLGPLSRAFGAV